MRYLLMTTRSFMAGPLAGKSDKAAERTISRLMSEDVVESHPFKGPMRYYTLTAEQAIRLGIHDGRGSGTQCLGFQALLQNYAMMASCILSEQRKVRLTRDEFAAKLPMICSDASRVKHFRTRYFIDESAKASNVVRVGLFVVDLGQNLRRLVRKVRREVERRRGTAFGPFVEEKLFCPFVLTAFPKKAEQIRSALANEAYPVCVEVVPGFADLF